jgi:hypothetical protein
MGMIFNSANTLKIIEKLNHRFGSTNFGNVNGSNRDASVLRRSVDTHTKATTLAINLTGSDDNKWKTWLDKMDSGGNSQPILDGMIMYLTDPNCLAIEFYAIQSDTVSVQAIPSQQQNTPYFGVILVETPTYDSAFGFERRSRQG